MNIKKEKGITLISLIVTIIIMLILAAVTIRIVASGGLIRNAEDAALETRAGSLEHEVNAWKSEVYYVLEFGGYAPTAEEKIEELLKDKLLTEKERNKLITKVGGVDKYNGSSIEVGTRTINFLPYDTD